MASGETGRLEGPLELDAAAIVSVMNRHGVRYVVIGAFAALAQQAPIAPTRDIDFTPDDSLDNLGRLSAALKELDARIWTGPDDGGLAFDHDAKSTSRSGRRASTAATGSWSIEPIASRSTESRCSWRTWTT